jgi:hypothetical protein
MYGYKLKHKKKIYYVPDTEVTIDPAEYFSGENIKYWWHKDDEDQVVDIFSDNSNDTQEEIDIIDG